MTNPNNPKINELRQKLLPNDKNLTDKNPCPTNILLYIAGGLQCPHDVLPWYDTIKEKTEGYNRHHGDMHRALIFAMYPELEPVLDYFKQGLRDIAEKSPQALADFEQQTITYFKLPTAYAIDVPLTPEQQKDFDKRCKQAKKNIQDNDIQFLPLTLQVIAKALQNSTDNSEIVNDAINTLHFANIALERQKEEVDLSRFRSSSELKAAFSTADKLIEMQNQKILDKDLTVINPQGFLRSSLMTEAQPFCKQKIDLTKALCSKNNYCKNQRGDMSL